jgi:Streptomycin adenylyltransferase
LDPDQKFWTWCWYVFGKIVRGELWEALDGLHSICSVALVPLLDWAAQRPHEGYRRLEHKTDPATASPLVATVAPVQPEALYEVLQAEMELFRSLRAMVFDRYGLTFELRPEEMLESQMRRRWVAREAP